MRTASAGNWPRRRLGGRAILAAVVLLVTVAACGGGEGSATDEARGDAADDVGAEAAPSDDRSADPTTTRPPTTTTTTTTTTADAEGRDDETEPGAPGSVVDGGPVDGGNEEVPTDPAPDERPLPTSPAELVAALDEAELALREPGIDEADAAPWGRRQQALYRVLAFNVGWEAEVLASVDSEIAAAVAANWAAQRELVALVNTERLSETLPAWRIVEPRPADELLGYYREAEAATGVPWEVLAAINLVETRMGRIDGVSSAGAIGPMQFLPTTWAECCEGDPTDPHDAINGAARYLVQRGAGDDLDRALFGYNNSDYYVTAIRSYAAVIEADPEAYYGYHAWQVYFLSAEGLVVIPVGYDEGEPIPAADYLAANPEARFGALR